MKDVTITVRLTSDQKKLLAEKAASLGMLTSEYVRLLVMKDLKLV